jgi:RNA polymerase sigma factor (sigma-70 family)
MTPPPSGIGPSKRVDLCEDRALLDRFRAGERTALEQVFRMYLPLVMHLVVRGVVLETGGRAFVQQEAQQDDLAQEVFLRLFSDAVRLRYDGVRPFAAYVRGITRNVVVDHLRRQGRSADGLARMTERELEPLSLAEGRGQEDQLLAREEAELVGRFVGGLSTEERALVELRFVACASQEQAARALGKTRQNIRTLEQHIKDRLRALLRGSGD